jgi:hypothetical protein
MAKEIEVRTNLRGGTVLMSPYRAKKYATLVRGEYVLNEQVARERELFEEAEKDDFVDRVTGTLMRRVYDVTYNQWMWAALIDDDGGHLETRRFG